MCGVWVDLLRPRSRQTRKSSPESWDWNWVLQKYRTWWYTEKDGKEVEERRHHSHEGMEVGTFVTEKISVAGILDVDLFKLVGDDAE